MFRDEAVMEVSQRDFLASLHRMIQLNNAYFVNQFDNPDERQAVLECLVTPGDQSQSKGGMLQNFSLQNV